MAHQDAGRYAAKHPPGTSVAPSVEQAIREKLTENKIACRVAHEIAATLGISPHDVGVGIDLLEARISHCQLGLFGHGQKEDTPSSLPVDPDLRSAIEAALIDGRLRCVDAWRIADTRGIPRVRVAKACDAMNLKVTKCQLGAF